MLQRKASNTNQLPWIDLGMRALQDLSIAVDRFDGSSDVLQLMFSNKIDLVEENAVGKGNLLNTFVDGAFRLFLLRAFKKVTA